MASLLFIICLVGFPVCCALAFTPTTETSSLTDRISGLKAQGEGNNKPGSVALRDQDEMNKSLFTRMVIPMLDRISKLTSGLLPVQANNELKIAIIQAGLVNSITPAQIMSAGYVLAVALPAMLMLVGFYPTGLNQNTACVVMAAVMGWRLPGMYIGGKASARKHQIQKDLPFTLDLISISVEAGMALDGAIAIVTEKTSGPLTDEFNQTLREMRLGKGRNDALIDMANRLGVDDLKSFITAVTYIAKLGGSLVDVIKIQAGAMRTKRRQRAEEKAMKTPVKIMIPLVLFIFPSMFIVILGPAGLTMMRQFTHVPGAH